jgi:hypothetical protein
VRSPIPVLYTFNMRQPDQVSLTNNQKYLRQLIRIKQDPKKSIARQKKQEKGGYLVSFLLFIVFFLFYGSLPIVASFMLVGLACIIISVSFFAGESAKTIPLILEVVDWQKIDQIKSKK